MNDLYQSMVKVGNRYYPSKWYDFHTGNLIPPYESLVISLVFIFFGCLFCAAMIPMFGIFALIGFFVVVPLIAGIVIPNLYLWWHSKPVDKNSK